MSDFIQIIPENLDEEHICCAFSDKKCADSYQKKKAWLREEFFRGYVFYRLNERAKVFIEYGPAEEAWLPIEADRFLVINCLWVSGKYKKNGLGKELLRKAEEDAWAQGKSGLVTVTGKKKFHFMGDGKWFQKQGFSVEDETDTGFVLLAKTWDDAAAVPRFIPAAREGRCPEGEGLTAYFSNRCPYAEFHVTGSLVESAVKRGIPLKIVKLETREQAHQAPSPATIFSLFYQGRFLTTDLSVCLDSRFDKLWNQVKM